MTRRRNRKKQKRVSAGPPASAPRAAFSKRQLLLGVLVLLSGAMLLWRVTVSLDSVQRGGDEVLMEALDWMDSARQGPFFPWIHLYDAHTPYEPPEPYLSRYGDVPFGRYDGEVAYVDSLTGELMEWLEQKELADFTIFLFLGDHGESLGEHRETTHG